MTDASAPGKLVIAGEYAVLEGAPALAASIDVRAQARVASISTPESVFFDALSGRAYFFNIDHERGLNWLEDSPGQSGKLLEAALSACLQHLKNYRQIPVIRVSMNSDAFYGRSGEQWQKLGIGSSAAVTVALMGALVSEFKLQLSPAELATVCHQAHRIFQEGRGSGIDVVTALHGGVVSAQSTTDAEELVVAERQWPEGLSILPVWTGVGASTTELLSRVSAFRDNNPGDYGRHMLQLVDLSMEADRVWQAGDAADVKTALGACDQALQAFDHDASVGIYTEPHHRIRALVEGKGAAYKVSGAGGGDFGLAITESTDVADLLRAACAEKGIMILERPFAAAGLIVSE